MGQIQQELIGSPRRVSPEDSEEAASKLLQSLKASGGEMPDTLCGGRLSVDQVQRLIRIDGHPIGITEMEYRVLELLAFARNNVVTRAMLLSIFTAGPTTSRSRRLFDVFISEASQEAAERVGRRRVHRDHSAAGLDPARHRRDAGRLALPALLRRQEPSFLGEVTRLLLSQARDGVHIFDIHPARCCARCSSSSPSKRLRKRLLRAASCGADCWPQARAAPARTERRRSVLRCGRVRSDRVRQRRRLLVVSIHVWNARSAKRPPASKPWSASAARDLSRTRLPSTSSPKLIRVMASLDWTI